MEFSVDFYKDEVRDGFYIPTAIKQAWAANLMVLSEIDRICEKYNITYYADWGTLLGAVRHRGYIPWDDDIDICMKRKDYKRFREVLDKELPRDFAVHDYRSKDNHKMFLIRIINSNKICFDEDHLNRYHNFPYMAVVDIFVLDYLYADKVKDRKRSDEIMHIIALADMIAEDNIRPVVKDSELTAIEQRYGMKIDRDKDNRTLEIELYELAEELMGEASYDESDNMDEIFPWVLKGDNGFDKHYYDEVIRIPFENTTIPVPKRYEEVLSYRFGDWRKKVKQGSLHEYPYFEGQKKNLQKVADFKLPEFSFDKKMLDKAPISDEQGSIKTISKEFVEQLEQMNDELKNTITNEGGYSDNLSDCQQLAVDYGTLTESVMLGNSKLCNEIIDSIQNYCDSLFQLYLLVTGESDAELYIENIYEGIMLIDKAFREMKQLISTNIIDRKEILFLPIGPDEWNSFSDVYKKHTYEDDCNIYVVPLPLMFKDCLGRVKISKEYTDNEKLFEGYPIGLPLVSWTSYDIVLHQPDVVYIQNPYDGENPCLTVPMHYYASNVRNYANKLIYIPSHSVGEFGREDELDMHNMNYYVTTPGVVYADEVYVQSDNMRQRYIEKLTEFAGEETKYIWTKKISV